MSKVKKISLINSAKKKETKNKTLKFLSKRLGWNLKNFSEFKQEIGISPLLKEEFLLALEKINGPLGFQINEIISEIERYISLKNINIDRNKEKYDIITKGLGGYSGYGGSNRDIKIIDFDNPENNLFTVVPNFKLKSSREEFISDYEPDIVCFVNGIPLIFFSIGDPREPLIEIYRQNYRDIFVEKTPQLFLYNAFVVIANEKEAKMGAIGNKFRTFNHWHRLKEDDSGDEKTIEILLQGTCEKNNFLDLLKNFTIFREETGSDEEINSNINKEKNKKLVKIIARNHQFIGVNLAVESFKKRKEKGGKIGTFWHTQGSGKSFSILFFAEKVRKEAVKNGEDIVFVIVVDRKELERQIFNNFKSCGVLGYSPEECKINQKLELKSKISDRSKSYIFCLINKFEDFDEKIEREVVIIADEAHRTQYGDMASDMYQSLQNSSRIGFTGTPILKDYEKTARYFGDYVSKYDFSRAIRDKVTVPLVYINKVSRAKKIDNDELEKLYEFNEDAPIENIERKIRFLEARLRNNAKDFVSYYSNRFFDIEKEKIIKRKAMFVCSRQEGCILMWNFVQEYWEEEIDRLKNLLEKPKIGEREAQRIRKKLELMEETEMKIVISNWNNVDLLLERLKKLYGDQLKMPQRESDEEKERKFKKGADIFRVVFVCSMWLTGFDVKSLTYLFIDKELKDHSLMQAIARPNRIDEGKTRGFIIDYFGLAKQIDKCIGKWGKSHENAMIITSENMQEKVSSLIYEIEKFLKDRGISIKQIIESKLTKEKKKKIREEIKKIMYDPKLKERFNKTCELLFEDTKYLIPEDFSKEDFKKLKEIKTFYKQINEKEKPKNLDIEIQVKVQNLYNKSIEFFENKENYSREINENINKTMIFYSEGKRQSFEEEKQDALKRVEEIYQNLDPIKKEEKEYIEKIKEICKRLWKVSSPEELKDCLGNLSNAESEYEQIKREMEEEGDYEEIYEGDTERKEREEKEFLSKEEMIEKVDIQEISNLINEIEFSLVEAGIYLDKLKNQSKVSYILSLVENKQKIINNNMSQSFNEKYEKLENLLSQVSESENQSEEFLLTDTQMQVIWKIKPIYQQLNRKEDTSAYENLSQNAKVTLKKMLEKYYSIGDITSKGEKQKEEFISSLVHSNAKEMANKIMAICKDQINKLEGKDIFITRQHQEIENKLNWFNFSEEIEKILEEVIEHSYDVFYKNKFMNSNFETIKSEEKIEKDDEKETIFMNEKESSNIFSKKLEDFTSKELTSSQNISFIDEKLKKLKYDITQFDNQKEKAIFLFDISLKEIKNFLYDELEMPYKEIRKKTLWGLGKEKWNEEFFKKITSVQWNKKKFNDYCENLIESSKYIPELSEISLEKYQMYEILKEAYKKINNLNFL